MIHHTFRCLAVIATAVGLHFPSLADAQETHLYSVRPEAITTTGELTGCSIVFSGAMIDDRSQVGELLSLDGSIRYQGYWGGELRPALLLKLVVEVADLDAETLTPSRPTTLSLLGLSDSSLKDLHLTSLPGEQEGAMLTAYQIGAIDSVLQRADEDDVLAVAFSRGRGGIDLPWKVPLPKEEVYLPFLECIRDLSRKLRDDLTED